MYAFIFLKKFVLWIEEWKEHPNPKSATKNYLRFLRYYIGKFLIRWCDALIVGGLASKKYAVSCGKNETDIFTAFQCSYDFKYFDNENYHGLKKICLKKFKFLYLGRIVPHKGLDILIHAFSSLRDIREDVSLIICGDGPFRQYCESIVSYNNTKDVHFLGSTNPKYVGNIFKNASVFVFPCHFNDLVYESWGLVVNEAMSMGVPVITTRAVGATYDMIEDKKNGLIVKENDTTALYNAMNKILNMDLTKMKINARKTFETINNYENMADNFTNAIKHASK